MDVLANQWIGRTFPKPAGGKFVCLPSERTSAKMMFPPKNFETSNLAHEGQNLPVRRIRTVARRV